MPSTAGATPLLLQQSWSAITAARSTLTAYRKQYGDAGEAPFLITGSTGCIEISMANASAAALLQLQRGDRVTIVPN